MSDLYWEDTYQLGYRFWIDKSGVLGKRSELDVLDKSLADQNALLFDFDPYKGTYKLKDMQVLLEQPIAPKVRDIAECDLSELRRLQTFSSNSFPKIINIKLSHALPPNGLLVFNCDHEKSTKLASLLDDISQPLTEAHLSDVIPGSYFLFKSPKLYRVMIIGQTRERYHILLIDYGMVETAKLDKLYLMKPEMDTLNYPSGMFIARIVGISEIPKDDFDEFREIMRVKQAPATSKNQKLKACVRKNESGELIIDFPALNGQKVTIGEQLSLTSFGKIAPNDPPLISYDTLINMQRSSKEDVQMLAVNCREEPSILETSFRPPSQASTTSTKKRVFLPPKIANENQPKAEESKKSAIFGKQFPKTTDLNTTFAGSDVGNGVSVNPKKVEQKLNEFQTHPTFGVQEQSSVYDSSFRSLSRRLTPPADKTKVDKINFSDCSHGMAKINQYHAQMVSSNINEKQITEEYDGEKTNSTGADVALSIPETHFNNVSSDVDRLSENTSICETVRSDQKNPEEVQELENSHDPVENNLEAAVNDIYANFRAKIEKSINEKNYKAYHMDMITIINMYECAQSVSVKKCFEDLRIYAHQKFNEITTKA